MLAVARDLFDGVGYEAATIRAVAQHAGVSVGSVFTVFEGKAELLYEVMTERLGGLYAELEQVSPYLRGSTLDKLRSVMAVHYGFESRRLNLFIAYIAASFSGAPGKGRPSPLGANVRFNAMLKDILIDGVASGEVRRDADLDAFLDALLACYFWNYRLCLRDGVEPAELIARMDRQLATLFQGVVAS